MFKGIFTSRKFYALLAATITIIGAVAAGELTIAKAIGDFVGLIMVYMGAIGVEKIGGTKK
jgi:hypothetical protein